MYCLCSPSKYVCPYVLSLQSNFWLFALVSCRVYTGSCDSKLSCQTVLLECTTLMSHPTHTELEVFISLWIRWVQLSDKFKEIKEANWKKENRFTALWWWWCETMQTKCSWSIPVVSCRLLVGGDISTWHISPLPFRFITAVAVQFHLCTDYACWLWKTNNILILG